MASPAQVTGTTDWAMVRERWLIENLDPSREKPYTLRKCAMDHGVAYQTVRNRACTERWRVELNRRQRARSEAAIEEAQSRFSTDEAEVRANHASMLDVVIGRFWRDIEAAGGIDFENLPAKQRAEIFTLLLKSHRDALGFASTTRVDHQLGGDATAREMQSRLREFLGEMQKAAAKDGATEEPTGEASITNGPGES